MKCQQYTGDDSITCTGGRARGFTCGDATSNCSRDRGAGVGPTVPRVRNRAGIVDRRDVGVSRSRPQRHQRRVDGQPGDRRPWRYQGKRQTTGASTSDGYAEHSFNWDVAIRVRTALEQLGVHTQMSRADDNSVGPGVDQRAEAANRMHADADVSIHADGGLRLRSRLYVNYSAPRSTTCKADRPSNWPGYHARLLVAAGLQQVHVHRLERVTRPRRPRGSQPRRGKPAVLVESRNMAQCRRGGYMETADGRQRYADAIAAGIVRTWPRNNKGGVREDIRGASH